MTTMAQTRPRWRSVTITGLLGMLLLAPSAAWAGPRDYDSAHRHDSDCYGSRVEYAHRHHVSHAHKNRGRALGHHKHRVAYFCRACNHYFGARAALYDHVVYRHRVPPQNLAISIRFGEFGWIFFGS